MQTQQTRSNPTIHRRKLFGGRCTAEEFHRKFAFPHGAKCIGCGTRPHFRAIIMCPLDEAIKRGFVRTDNLMQQADLLKVVVHINESVTSPNKKYVRMNTAYFCSGCSTTVEKELAKTPSWCIVEINRGPGQDLIITSG